MNDFSKYMSPFSWRYGSEEMRKIFSEEHKIELWRKIWVSLAQAQFKFGLISKEEINDLEKNQNNFDIERILEIEKETRHDVVAGIKEFSEKAKIAAGKIHLGATSMDIVDNADMMRQMEGIALIEKRLRELLAVFAKQIEKYSGSPCMGFTHLQPAEPTTIGYRLSLYSQDLLTDLKFLKFVKESLRSKGIKGAVGTSASYSKLVREESTELEKLVMEKLGIDASLISSQTYSRKFDFFISSLLSSIAQSLSKFAFDLRIMQSPGFGEWQEPFGKSQVGSSAMPFKKNPMKSEQICSLSRLVENLSRIFWENGALTLLERTLDDSANKRVAMPEIFLAVDEMLCSATKIIDGIVINQERVGKNLENYWPFSATEAVIIEAVKKGANRQLIHEVLREISMKAWEEVQTGEENPMIQLINENKELGKYLSKDEINNLMNPSSHLGTAPKRAKQLAQEIKKAL